MTGGSGSPLRVLHTTPFVPFPPESGGKLVPYHHALGLARRGHRVTLVAPIRRSGDQAAREAIAGAIDLAPVPCAPVTPRRLFERVALRGSSIRVARHRLPEVEREVVRLLRRESFDVVLLDSLFTAYLTPSIRRAAPGLPVVLVEHNVESLLFERYLADRSAPVRLAGRFELGRIRAAEAVAVRAADEVLVLSERDGEGLRTLAPGAAFTLLPPGAPTRPGERIPPPRSPHALLFLGNYRWKPNRDAARHLVREILPRVRRVIPDAEVLLAGEDPEGRLRSLHRPDEGARVLGRVEDASETIRAAAVFVVPLRVGGGVRLKILEALANERPVVTTPLGGEGIPLRHGVDAMIADEWEEFARCSAELLADGERAGRIAREGRRLVETDFGWDAIAERLEGILRRVAGAGHRSAG